MILPSVVLFDDGEIVVGRNAKNISVDTPYSVCQFIKRHMGERDFSFYVSDKEQYTPEEISAIILRSLKISAEKRIKDSIEGAVITVPAYFNDSQRNATKDAGEIAGLNVVGIINEPTAAALAYCHNSANKDGIALVYDLGGGTFDVTILKLQDNLKRIDVLSTDGMNDLGGFDFDNEIMNSAIDYYDRKYKVSLNDDDEILQDLRIKCEKAKIALSSENKTTIEIEINGKNREFSITRDEFESLISHYVDDTVSKIESAIHSAGLKWKDIDKVLLVGGSTRIPYIRETLRNISGIEPSTELNPDEAVSLGAAYYAHDLALERIEKAKKEIEFVDVISHSIGVGLLDRDNAEISSVAITKNSRLPANGIVDCYTRVNNQGKLLMSICQGENRLFKDNTFLGESKINIPSHSAGYLFKAKVECSVDGVISLHLVDPRYNSVMGEFSIDRVNNLSHKEVCEKKDSLSSKMEDTFEKEVSKMVEDIKKPDNSNTKSIETEDVKEPQKKDPLEELNSLIGLEEVKQELIKIKRKLEFDQERARRLGVEVNSENGHHFVFRGNPGTGKTTVARLVGEILHDYGIVRKTKPIEVSRSDLVGEFIGQTAVKTREVIKRSLGGVLFVDEAYTLYKKDTGNDFGREALEELLKAMEDHRKDLVVILAGYKKEMEELLDANPGITSRITDYIDFPDYTEEELLQIAHSFAEKNYYSISEDGEKAFLRLINKRKVNEKFGNARDVRTILEKAFENKALRYSSEAGEVNRLSILSAKDFGVDLKEDASKGAETYLAELNALIGLEQVKKEVRGIIARVNYIKQEINSGNMPETALNMNMNMCFLGGPGTGKTTVARLYSSLLNSVGILKKGDLIEASRSDLVGAYQGQTALKTREICQKAYGGVLFIDEAYSLVRNHSDSFGNEALDTLIKEMEDNRDKLVVILAGYTREMNEFFDANSGLKSRIGKFIEFPDYTDDELFTIFKGICNDHGMILDEGGENEAKARISQIYAQRDGNFGNAREMRNLYQNVEENLILRVMDNGITDPELRHTIIAEDFI